MFQRMRVAVSVGVVLAVVGLVGCNGGRRASVTGKVTIEKKEPGVAGVVISFVGGDNQAVTTDVAADGSFTANGVLVGPNKVSLNWNGPAEPADLVIPDGADDKTIKEIKGKIEAERNKPRPANPIPERYNDPSKSPLQTVVEAGQVNTFVTNLTK